VKAVLKVVSVPAKAGPAAMITKATTKSAIKSMCRCDTPGFIESCISTSQLIVQSIVSDATFNNQGTANLVNNRRHNITSFSTKKSE
jgi:hypothetical protein